MYQFTSVCHVSKFDFLNEFKRYKNNFHFVSEVAVVRTIIWLMENAKVKRYDELSLFFEMIKTQ